MPAATLRVFRHGEGTTTLLEFPEGQGRQTILRHGAGRFFEPTFETEEAASVFCGEELRKDSTAILYIVDGNSIVRTVLDQERQKQLERPRARRYGVLSTLAFSVVCGVIIALMHPFGAAGANVALAGGFIALYLFFLMCFGTRNVEPAILITLILVLLCMLISALKRAQERSQKAKHAWVVPSSLRASLVLEFLSFRPDLCSG